MTAKITSWDGHKKDLERLTNMTNKVAELKKLLDEKNKETPPNTFNKELGTIGVKLWRAQECHQDICIKLIDRGFDGKMVEDVWLPVFSECKLV